MWGILCMYTLPNDWLHWFIFCNASPREVSDPRRPPLPLLLAPPLPRAPPYFVCLRILCCCLCVFRDIAPVAPTHILIIPKHRNGLTQLRHATADQAGVLGYMLEVAAKIAAEEKLEGFRWEAFLPPSRRRRRVCGADLYPLVWRKFIFWICFKSISGNTFFTEKNKRLGEFGGKRCSIPDTRCMLFSHQRAETLRRKIKMYVRLVWKRRNKKPKIHRKGLGLVWLVLGWFGVDLGFCFCRLSFERMLRQLIFLRHLT